MTTLNTCSGWAHQLLATWSLTDLVAFGEGVVAVTFCTLTRRGLAPLQASVWCYRGALFCRCWGDKRAGSGNHEDEDVHRRHHLKTRNCSQQMKQVHMRWVDEVFVEHTLHHIYLRKHRKAQKVCIYFFLVEPKKDLSHPIALLIRMTTPFPLFCESLLPRGRHWIQYETLTRSLECMLMAHGCVQDMIKANIKRIIPGNIFCKQISCDKSLGIQLAMRKKEHGSTKLRDLCLLKLPKDV